MYLTKLKTVLTKAIQLTFDAEYPIAEFRDLHASIEMPVNPQNYPGIWVDYEPMGQLRRMGVAHLEVDDENGLGREFTRWQFQGHASYTLVALTSLERDRLHDEMVRVMAFGDEYPGTRDFKAYLMENNYLNMAFDFDEITVRGMTNSVGTPWQTDDMIYEVEIVMECFGDFVADHQTFDLIPLSEVRVHAYSDQEPDPTNPNSGGWQ